MLTNQQIETIDYLILGTMTIQEIADKVGCTTRVIYKWKKNEEFKAELDNRSHDFKTGIVENANDLLVNKLGQAITNIIDIANDKGSSDKVRFDANKYIVDRILGNTTTKIETSTQDDKSKNKDIDIDQLVNEIKEDNNVIDISQMQ